MVSFLGNKGIVLRWLLLGSLLLDRGNSETLVIETDSSWKTTTGLTAPYCPGIIGSDGPSWTEGGFDDSAWSAAASPSPRTEPLGWKTGGCTSPPVLLSDFIWDSDPSTLETFMRKQFDIPAGAITSAVLHFQADDDMMLYVNGKLADSNSDSHGYAICDVDLTSYFIAGQTNTLAVYGWDGGDCHDVFWRVHAYLGLKLEIEYEPFQYVAVVFPDEISFADLANEMSFGGPPPSPPLRRKLLTNANCHLTPIRDMEDLDAAADAAVEANEECLVGIYTSVEEGDPASVNGWYNIYDDSAVPASTALWNHPTEPNNAPADGVGAQTVATINNRRTQKLRDVKTTDLFNCVIYLCE